MSGGTCAFCERQCWLEPGGSGFCQMYIWEGSKAVERFPQRYSCMFVNHIEAVPFYHFQPGSWTFTLGGAGCNFDCEYCSNAYVARSDPEPLLTYNLPPEKVVAFARQYSCRSMTFGINEPTVALPTLLELSHVAAEAGYPVGALTNGYMTAEVAVEMGKAFRFVNVSLKAFGDAFYREHAGVPSHEVVMRNIEILHKYTHVEVSTPIVQGLNDEDIPAIARFIASVDREMAWHVFRLLPEYKMADRERPRIQDVNAALEEARQLLPFIYFANFVGSQWVSTLCPDCHNVVIERINLGGCGSRTRAYSLRDGQCSVCGRQLPIVGGPPGGQPRDG